MDTMKRMPRRLAPHPPLQPEFNICNGPQVKLELSSPCSSPFPLPICFHHRTSFSPPWRPPLP